jgi:catechol 2,3-dioxygenase-like lactoylglutathione lyase family enzyme
MNETEASDDGAGESLKRHYRAITAVLVICTVCVICAIRGFTFSATAENAKPTLDLGIYGHVAHAGWVVKDLDRVVNCWEKLGIHDIERHGFVRAPEVTYRGKRVVARLKTAVSRVGGAEIDWIQPVAGESAYADFLRDHGEGIHHLAFRVSSQSQYEDQVQFFASNGVGQVETGNWTGKNGTGRFVYLDTAPRGGGITFELIYESGETGAGKVSRRNDYPFTQIVQYAFVVRDLSKVNEFYKGLGFGDMGSERFIGLDRRYNGAPSNYEMDLGWWKWGDVPFEWIQSRVAPNVYDDYLKAHGEGLHHLAVNVDDLDKAEAIFLSKGVGVAQSGAWDIRGSRGRFAYIEPEGCGGVTIELLWNEPSK